MDPNTTIDPGLVDNTSEFTHPFFSRFELRPAPSPLELPGGLQKTYSFPTFYADVSCAIAIFLCDYERARTLLPHPAMRPVRMPRGRAVVLFSCYRYRKVMHLAPYNEIAMTLPITLGGWAPPVLPLVLNLRKRGYHVFSMPVTSLENQIRGTRIWGLPKIVETIDITSEEERCRTVAYDDDGLPYFDLTVPTTGSPKRFDECSRLYSVLDGRLLTSQTCYRGDFNVSTSADALWRTGRQPERPTLVLGNSPRAETLRSLHIEPAAFQFRYCPSMSSCFDLPEDD
jgi:hypothetical protein